MKVGLSGKESRGSLFIPVADAGYPVCPSVMSEKERGGHLNFKC